MSVSRKENGSLVKKAGRALVDLALSLTSNNAIANSVVTASLNQKVTKFSGTDSGNTYVTVDQLAYDRTNKKLGLKVNGADTVIPFSGGGGGLSADITKKISNVTDGLTLTKDAIIMGSYVVDSSQRGLRADLPNGTQVLLAGARAANYYGYDFQGGIIPQIFLPTGTKLYTSLSTFDNGLAVYEPLEKFVMPDLQKRLAYVTSTEITAPKDCVLFGSFYTRVTTRKIRITLPDGNYVYPCGGSNSGYYSYSFGGVSIPPLFIPKGCKLYQDSDGYDNGSFLAIYEPLEL